MEAVSPVSYVGVKKYQTEAGNWVKIRVWYEKDTGRATMTYSIRFNYGEDVEYTDYYEIASITYEAGFVTSEMVNYVLALRPISVNVIKRNILDFAWNSSMVESFGIYTENITYIMFTRNQTNYDDGEWAPNDNVMGVVLNLPFDVCSHCDGLAALGGHGVCTEEGCGKNLCAGHVHGQCDHDNANVCDPKCWDSTEHRYCPDCDTYFRLMYEGNGYFLEECDMCEENKDNEDGSFGA